MSKNIYLSYYISELQLGQQASKLFLIDVTVVRSVHPFVDHPNLYEIHAGVQIQAKVLEFIYINLKIPYFMSLLFVILTPFHSSFPRQKS